MSWRALIHKDAIKGGKQELSVQGRRKKVEAMNYNVDLF